MGPKGQVPEAGSDFANVVPARRWPWLAAAPLLLALLLLALATPADAATRCAGTSAGCDSVHGSADAALAAASPGDTVVIRDQDLAGLAVANDDLTVDARLNRWGTDSWRAVAGKVLDLGAGNDVRVLPFLRASDGRQDPPSPIASPAVHCSGAGFVPLDLHDALGCAHPGGSIFVPPSADPVDPTPPGLGPYTVFKNRVIVIVAGEPQLGAEDDLLTDLTICSAAMGGAVCDASARDRNVLTSMTGDTVIVKADGLTLRGFTITVSGEASPGENHAIEVPTSMSVDGLTVQGNAFRPDLLGGQAEAENGVRGRMTNALIEDNEFRGFAGAIFFRPYGGDNTATGNTIVASGTGVLTWSPGTFVDGNLFDGVLMGVDVAEVQGDPTTSADGNVLRRNDFAGARIGVRNRALNTDVTVDARLNDWGTDSWRTIPPKIDNTGASNKVLFVPFLRTSDGQQDPPSVVVIPSTHCGGVPQLSIGEALGCAHAGSRVLVQPSPSVDPTPHLESVTVNKNSLDELLSGLTMCSTVAYFECATVDEPARWGIFQPSIGTKASWGTPPVAHTGQAIRIAGTGGSTSLFTRDALTGEGAPQIADLHHLGVDVLRQSGVCPAGSPRLTLRIDADNDGDKDVDYQLYPGSGFACPPVGQWVHLDFLASDQWGGIPGTTQAGAHVAQGVDHRILSMNLIVDGGAATDVLWFDNQRYQDSFFREPIEETCSESALEGQVPCSLSEPEFNARPGTILDGTGTSSTALRIIAPSVTVQGMTIRVTDGAERVINAEGASGFRLVDNHVQAGELDPLPLTPTKDTFPSAGSAATYYENPFVQEMLGSEAFAALVAERSGDPGYLFSVPLLTPLPHVGIAYSGTAPPGLAAHATTAAPGEALLLAPFGEDRGLRYLAYEGVQASSAMERLPDDLVTHPLDDAALSTPVTTAASAGIGPGTFVIMRNPDGNFRCSANFVWKNVSTGDLFLGAAGHCFSQAGGANSAQRSFRIEVCVKNCFTDTVRCGTVTCTPEFGFTTVILRNCPHPLNTLTDELPSAPGTGKCRGLYSSGDSGAGNDFGAVQIPSQFNDLVRFSIPNFGGPTGTRTPGPALGDFVVHYGHGAAFGELFPTEGRAGVVLGTKSGATPSLATHFTCLCTASPGDSGSDMAVGKLRAGTWFVGERAAGVLTHLALINTVQDPLKPPGATIATTIPRAIQLASLGTGMGPQGPAGSPTSQRYNFCLMTIAADCVDVTPVLGAGLSATGATGLVVDSNTFAQGVVGAEVSPGADGIRGAPLSGAVIRGNSFVDWLGSGVALTGGLGTGNLIADNVFERGCTGVRLDTVDGVTVRDNVFGALACQGAHVLGSGALATVFRENDLRAPPIAMRVTGNNRMPDARLNDWGDYDYRTLPRRVLIEGTNTRVLQVPFIDADGLPEPPLVKQWNGAVAREFLGLQEAHDDPLTVAGTKIQVPSGTLVPVSAGGLIGGMVEKHARTPWLESVLLSKSGITLCGQQLSRDSPCSIAGPGKPALDATGLGSSALRITGSGVTVQGMTVRVAAEPSRAIDARGAASVVLRDNTVEAGPGTPPGELVGGVLPVATAPLPLQGYLENPFVAATYGSAALGAIRAAHAGDEGLVAVVPSSYGHVALVYSGDAPPGVSDGQEQGLPVKVYDHVTGETLADPVEDWDPDAASITVLDESDFDVATGAPMGPKVPSTLVGAGPGSHLLILWGGSGFRCTANFVFKDAAGNFYLGTAGHCIFQAAQAGFSDTLQPGYLQPTSIQVCVAGCQGGTLVANAPLNRQGTFVNLGANRVLYGQQRSTLNGGNGDGFGEDYAWIRIPAAFNGLLRPYEWLWGGPTGMVSGRPADGSPVVHYGHGLALGESFLTQGRAGIAEPGILVDDDGSYEALGWVTGGDSGSASLTGAVRLNSRLVGDEAIGDITHSIVVVGAPLFIGTMTDNALNFLQARTGNVLTLVNEVTSVIPGPVTGSIGIDISNTVGAVVSGNTLVGGAAAMQPSAGVEGFNADLASIDANEVRDWTHGVILEGGAAGNAVDDNRLGENCNGISLSDAPDNLVRRNTIAGNNCAGVVVTSFAGGAASDGNLFRLNLFRANAEAMRVTNVDGIVVDARANDWGQYYWRLVKRQPVDTGSGNDVRVIPFLLPDGTLEPGLITVTGGTCLGRMPEAPETDCGFLGINEALAFTVGGSVAQVQGSLFPLDPTPRREVVTMAGDMVTLCSSPAGGMVCDASAETALVDGTGLGPTVLLFTGDDNTVDGFTLRLAEDGATAVDATGTSGNAVRHSIIEAGSGAAPFDPLAEASAFGPASGPGSLNDPWAREVLASQDFQDLVARHEGDRGYLGAVPVTSPRSVALLYQGGDPPSVAGERVLGAPVEAKAAIAKPAMRPIPADVARQIFEKAEAPDGPQQPRAPDGLGPGTLLIIAKADGTFGCTANFVWRNAADPSEVYLGAAGHCFLPQDPFIDAQVNPPAVVTACIRGCDVDDLGLGAFGEFVSLGPVRYAIQQGELQGMDAVFGNEFCQVGCDFGIVRVPASLMPDVRPWMWFWRGPTGMESAQTGEVLVQYGFGLGVGMTFPTQGRAYVATGTQSGALPDGNRHLAFYGPAAPGDSGSAIADSAMPGGEVLRGNNAVGILTHLILFGNSTAPVPMDPLAPTGATVGTTVQRAAQLVQAGIGMTLTLVTEDEVLAPPPPPPPPPPVVVTVGVELAGSVGVTVADGSVTVSGGDVTVGIENDAATTGATVEGNSISAGNVGVRVSGSGATVADNSISAGDLGVSVSGPGAVVSGNTITGPGEEDPLAEDFGILVGGAASGYLFEDNAISDWAHAGIGIAGPAGPGTVLGNTLSFIGRSAIYATNSAAGNAVRIEDNDIQVNGLRGINLEATVGAVVLGNRFVLDAPAGGVASPGASAGVWVQGATGTKLTGNAFTGTGTAAVAISDLVVDGASIAEPSSVVLRRNLMRLDGNTWSLQLAPEVDGLSVDARLNDWGVYNFRLLPLRVLDQGMGNTVLQIPFLMPDGSQEPPAPSAIPGSHCGAAGKVPMDLGEALGCAHPQGYVLLRPSVNLTDPTPWPAAVTIDVNSEGEALDGLRLCSAPVGVNDCSQPQAQGVLLEGPLTVAAQDVTLRGLTFTGRAPGLEAQQPVAATHNHWEAYKLSQVKARITGPSGGSVVVVPFLDRDARTPILPPQAAFEPSLTTTDRLTPVTFTDTSAVGTKPLEAWTWAFGDGLDGVGATASHTYGALGDFTARLTVRDEAELTSSASRVVRVVNLVPHAVFTFGPDPANRAEPTVFTDASLDRDGTIAAWLWTLPDGSTSTASQVSYTFDRLGTFPVTLRVTDNDGDSATVTRAVSVVNLAPTASFTWGPEVPMLLQPVQFDDLSSDPEGSLQSWLWDFGDGMTSYDAEPVHAYATGGWHHVTLTVTDPDGEARSLTRDLYVCAPGLGDTEALLSLEHIHFEFEACIRVTDIPDPL